MSDDLPPDCHRRPDGTVCCPTSVGDCTDDCTHDDEPEDDGAPCCRAVVTSGDPTMHEPGCYDEQIVPVVLGVTT